MAPAPLLTTDEYLRTPELGEGLLSPNPRIGRLQERIDWFAGYGVREIWVLHQLTRRFESLRTQNGRVSAHHSFDDVTPIRSDVLPDFSMLVGDILDD